MAKIKRAHLAPTAAMAGEKPPARRSEPDWRAIRLLVLDVDGVLTDGGITLDWQGREIKRFSSLDGAGIKYWQRVGMDAAIISGRGGHAAAARAAELGISSLRLNVKEKLPVYLDLLERLKLSDRQVAVMGDDLPDVPMMVRCGLAVAPANAVAEVKAVSHLVTVARGGDGAVREAIETILRKAGLWERVLGRYNLVAPA